MPKYTNLGQKKILVQKNLEFFETPHYDFGTAGDV